MSSIVPGSPKLESYPTVGPMLGGVEVNVSGPCFHRPHERIKAKFGDIVVECMRVNMMIASCVAPVMRQRGVVDLSISADSGRSYRFSRPFTVGKYRRDDTFILLHTFVL